jgi:hypothetical protein
VRPRTIVDTGPLVAFLDRKDHYHEWAREQLGEIEPPLDSCEAVFPRPPSSFKAYLEELKRCLS